MRSAVSRPFAYNARTRLVEQVMTTEPYAYDSPTNPTTKPPPEPPPKYVTGITVQSTKVCGLDRFQRV